MRPLELREKKALYKFSKILLTIFGFFLILYGGWYFISQFLASPHDMQFWFGIFPMYIGSMMLLISVAMKVEWFTDMRRFW